MAFARPRLRDPGFYGLSSLTVNMTLIHEFRQLFVRDDRVNVQSSDRALPASNLKYVSNYIVFPKMIAVAIEHGAIAAHIRAIVEPDSPNESSKV